MNAVLQATVIRLGGIEALTEAVNARIQEIEAEHGRAPGYSRATVHPATVRAWLRRSSPPRYAVVVRAVSELAGRPASEIWPPDTVDDVNRRDFLGQAAAAISTGVVGSRIASGLLDPSRSLLGILSDLGAAPSPDVEEYAHQAAELWHACWHLDPADLAYRAGDHAEHARVLLARSQRSDHRRLADSVGLVTILVGRTTFSDLGRYRTTEQVWQLAADQLEGTADHPLLACLYGHMAFVPGWAGRWDEADHYLQMAAGHARRGGGPGVRSWIHAVAAECLTLAGKPEDAVKRIERARETFSDGGAHDDPWWLDYYSPRRLDGFDASVCLSSARAVLSRASTARATRHALDRVERALGQLLPEPDVAAIAPQDCVTLLDRATAHALIHDDDQALSLAETACRSLGRRPYHAAVHRLDTLADILPANRVGTLQEIERTYLHAA